MKTPLRNYCSIDGVEQILGYNIVHSRWQNVFLNKCGCLPSGARCLLIVPILLRYPVLVPQSTYLCIIRAYHSLSAQCVNKLSCSASCVVHFTHIPSQLTKQRRLLPYQYIASPQCPTVSHEQYNTISTLLSNDKDMPLAEIHCFACIFSQCPRLSPWP